MTAITDLEVRAADGGMARLDTWAGKVLLIVNTASKCGFTPQYEALEDLHRDLGPRGFEVLGFPCNQFGAQEPGDAAEIFAKIDVNGPDTDPLFDRLKTEAPGVLGSKAVKWNFTKFLVDRNGRTVRRYAPATKPEDIVKDIEALL